tara:strand:- start:1977 stop:2201 length:225 start_codon:yes stop_codon:yes gene_type:complete
MKKYVNGQLVEVIGDEKTAIENLQSIQKTEKQTRVNAETTRKNNLASAITKLKSSTWSALTSDEISALFGGIEE